MTGWQRDATQPARASGAGLALLLLLLAARAGAQGEPTTPDIPSAGAAAVAAGEAPEPPALWQDVAWDGDERAVVLALDEHLWVAFARSDGRKLRTWDGGVPPAAHAPPALGGLVYAEGETRRWELRSGPQRQVLTARALPPEVDSGGLLLRTRLELVGQPVAVVEERVRLGEPADRAPVANRFVLVPADGLRRVLQRSFRLDAAPARGELVLVLNDLARPETLPAIGSHGGTWSLRPPDETGWQACGATLTLGPDAAATWTTVHRVPPEAAPAVPRGPLPAPASSAAGAETDGG